MVLYHKLGHKDNRDTITLAISQRKSFGFFIAGCCSSIKLLPIDSYPDFMEKLDKPYTYESQMILGILYRIIKN